MEARGCRKIQQVRARRESARTTRGQLAVRGDRRSGTDPPPRSRSAARIITSRVPAQEWPRLGKVFTRVKSFSYQRYGWLGCLTSFGFRLPAPFSANCAVRPNMLIPAKGSRFIRYHVRHLTLTSQILTDTGKSGTVRECNDRITVGTVVLKSRLESPDERRS